MNRTAVRSLLLTAMLATATFGCQPAGQYPARPTEKAATEEKPPPPPRDVAWLEPNPVYDVPIFFLSETDPAWAKLPAFWNQPDLLPAAIVSPIGLPPLEAAVIFICARQLEKVVIKVPRGLPDPTPLIPTANPPTVAKWRLGKRLFFDKVLQISKYESLACANCHDPKTGFTEDWAVNKYGSKKNTPSLINCVFNRHQFWDGRVRYLEQTIVTELADENLPPEERPARHLWGGLVKVLGDSDPYRREFRAVFGVHHPTQDTIAKALATYMRTILSGDSLYDRAESARKKRGGAAFTTRDFEAVLDEASLQFLEQSTKQDASAALDKGRQLFFGKARCVLCHTGPLFTDHDFHNVGLDENDIDQLAGLNQGRFDYAPMGLKEVRLIGAYKTPTLRALPRTAPYMHNGKFKTLADVVDFFDKGVDARWHHFLDPKLLAGPETARPLDLSREDIRSLVLFLRTLDGRPVDRMVATVSE